MELIRGLRTLRDRHRGCVATLGAFDGIHRGHQVLLRELIDRGRSMDLPTVLICFEPLPREFFSPHDAPARLMSFREKFIVLRQLGLDRVLRIQFTEAFRSVTADDFIKQAIVSGLDVKLLVVGDDLRFGAGRTGNAEFLRNAGRQHGFEVLEVPSIREGEERVSSSRIRDCLERSDFDTAARLLGRPYSISGKVVYGNQLGRTIEVPTANLELHRFRAPLSGVYVVEVRGVDGTPLAGVANVGCRPTIGDLTKAILEVHIIDFRGNLYGKHLDVRFRHKLRDERKFESVAVLRQTIADDIVRAREWLAARGR